MPRTESRKGASGDFEGRFGCHSLAEWFRARPEPSLRITPLGSRKSFGRLLGSPMCRVWVLARGMALNWRNAGPGKVSLHDLWVEGRPLAQPDGLADQDRLLGSGQRINAVNALVVTVLGALAEVRQVAAKVVPLPARARRAVDEPAGVIAPCRHVSPLAPDGPCSTFVEPHVVARSVQRRQH